MNMIASMPKIAVIVLAAGQGTRMKSTTPKVMHKIAGRPMIDWSLAAAQSLNPYKIITVIRRGMESIEDHIETPVCYQETGEGTAAAVRAALPHIDDSASHILVLFGDTPFITPETLHTMIHKSKETKNWGVGVLGFFPEREHQYGRLIQDNLGGLKAIVEHKDATEEERQVELCNSGVMLINGQCFRALLDMIEDHNKKHEFYLTDMVKLAYEKGLNCFTIEAPEQEVMGINSKAELADAEFEAQTQMRMHALAEGVTMIDPDTVYFSHDTTFGTDVIIEPNVFFGEGVHLGDGVHVKAFTHIEGATIGAKSAVGPFARLRKGSELEENVHIGNFVEVKNSTLGKGVKAGHLSYLGDANIGTKSNVGAGTITCNYDGFKKARTNLGSEVFVGSNTSLVAPLSIGDRSFIAAGSVVVEDAGSDALIIARGKQNEIKDWATNFREKNTQPEE